MDLMDRTVHEGLLDGNWKPDPRNRWGKMEKKN